MEQEPVLKALVALLRAFRGKFVGKSVVIRLESAASPDLTTNESEISNAANPGNFAGKNLGLIIKLFIF